MKKLPRASLTFASVCIGTLLLATGAQANDRRHALSLIGTPKYAADFKHFSYVNPDAPKGGAARLSTTGTFDTLNIIPYKGNRAAALGLIYDQLMATSLDEASTEYAQLAEWVTYPDDFSSVTYKLRDNARWHDGKPITPDDVIFSLNVLKEQNPLYSQYYKNVTKAEQTGDNQVTFTFDQENNRELPLIVGQLTIFPKHFYEGEDGAKRNPGETWLEAPLGSGPYRVKRFEAGRFIEYERVEDYWGADLPVNAGKNNIDVIRFDYFLDRVPEFEAFKAGRLDFFQENSAKNWSTAYDFPALKAGKVVKRDDIHLENPEPMQAFVLNLRREKFQDPRVRQAFNLMFNFEWMNKNVFFSLYKRTSSFFENTDLSARGLPEGKELEILESVRDQVPPEVFTTEYKNPVNSDAVLVDRRNWRNALKLMEDAGWTVKNNVLTNEKGQLFEVEFLYNQPTSERIISPYRQALARLGVKATMRLVDAAQYKRRLDTFDFDITTDVFAQSESPGNEQRDYWGSQAADRPGGQNTPGIKDPAVDKLIERVIFATDREDLIAATRALDRVLLWNHYVVPQFYAPNERIAYWHKYGHPDPLPSRSIGFPTVWWYDEEKANKLSTN
ncbi:MAG: extracellular solute-binding protein [Rhodomicrobiaceae bacterium]